ncbi:uncharacterized protein LOC143281136 [Babylonia areolata]|uniref:uncharacterized protein LOC143281136 n=1 Tax=Babylonia areolata TaxID=304850 RepID=UPI003FD20320
MSTLVLPLNETVTTSPLSPADVTDVLSTLLTPLNVTSNVSTATDGGCGKDGGPCNVTQPPGGLALCTRLAPPPVPPWLRESPGRLYQMTKHCRSWSLYQELCNNGTSNSTLGYPRYVDTSEGEVKQMALSPGGLQWVIPALALVVLLLLLVLGLVLYKNYRRPHKKSMYRVAGSGYRFKPPQSAAGSWAGGPLVESETSDSYLGQPPGAEAGGDPLRHNRSPVCRLLEQTQYVATPTEDEHRPRPSGPPAFTSPAYFLPALAWLRLPILRGTWPGESNGAARDTTRYNVAQPLQCHCGETTHHWRPEGEGQGRWGAEPRNDDDDDDNNEDPEYSEIPEGQPHYSTLNPPPRPSPNGIGPYEYEMQERTNGQVRPQPGAPQQQQQLPPTTHRPRTRHGPGHHDHHRYEKLWPCGHADNTGLAPRELSSSIPGTCENGWLSRYRLPSPILPASDPPCRRLLEPDHALLAAEGGVTGDDLTSDSELLPGEGRAAAPSDCGLGRPHRDRRPNSRCEVKYPNPVYEGCGRHGPPPPASSPLLSRLWGYISWNKR